MRLGAVLFASIVPASAVAMLLWSWDSERLRSFSSQETLLAYFREDGVIGPVACILAQFIQVVIFVIPGEITQLAAGYIFGTGQGFLFAAIGILLGSSFNFYIGRLLGGRLRHFLGADIVRKVNRALNSDKGRVALFLLFLVPGTPKDAMCYPLGLSGMTVTEFLVITGLARMPALLASVLFGASAST